MARGDRICVECKDISNAWKGGFKRGYFICKHCVRRNKFPNLFKKIYGDISFKSKPKKKYRRFKREEQTVLYYKHAKDMSPSEFKEHMDKMKDIIAIVKSSARQNKPKKDFKREFGRLTERKVKG